jgi:hypothetical protein
LVLSRWLVALCVATSSVAAVGPNVEIFAATCGGVSSNARNPAAARTMRIADSVGWTVGAPLRAVVFTVDPSAGSTMLGIAALVIVTGAMVGPPGPLPVGVAAAAAPVGAPAAPAVGAGGGSGREAGAGGAAGGGGVTTAAAGLVAVAVVCATAGSGVVATGAGAGAGAAAALVGGAVLWARS